MSANLPEDLSGRQSAEAEALERHTVLSTCVRAEALEQQKAEALKQQEAEALEGRGLRRQPVEASRLKLQPDPKRVLLRRHHGPHPPFAHPP